MVRRKTYFHWYTGELDVTLTLYSQVATTRLDSRLYRPNMEACRDPVQARLVQEVHELDESVEALTNQLRCTEDQHQDLVVSH